MKILVTYATRYGSTREYAEWIAADLGADIRPQEAVRAADLGAYDVIVV
jgi:menaquinone-dependent protoporphyrinogen IX oxidase